MNNGFSFAKRPTTIHKRVSKYDITLPDAVLIAYVWLSFHIKQYLILNHEEN